MFLSMHNWMRAEPIDVTIRRLAKHGYDAIEIEGEPSKYNTSEVRGMLREYNLRCFGSVSLMFEGRDLIHADETVRASTVQYLKDCVTMVKELEGEEMTIVPSQVGKVAAMASPEEEWAWAVEGLREVLMTRTSIKSEFRISQTVIAAGKNNPLKFSISAEQAMEALVKPPAKGYLAPTEAAEQALNDIKAHEIAMMTGMEAALKGILSRLSPDVLADKIETSSGFGSILKGKKARYWEVYEKMYADISDQAENDFHELFSKEFARAYQDQLERLK